MKSVSVRVWVGLLVIFGVFVGIAIAAELDKGPATIKIDLNSSGKAVPAFSHSKHQDPATGEKGCIVCHHNNKPGEKMGKCGGCHTQASAKDAKTAASGFKDAFHKVCIECHKKQTSKPDLKKCPACHGK